MAKEVFFSVVIPVHNKLPHLERSVNSVLNQTYPHFELILVDDASTDGSYEKLEAFKDSRITILKRDTPGPGGYAARNLGINYATGKWICFLDADDEWELQVLETLYEMINKDPEVELISWGWYLTKGDEKVLDKNSLLNRKYNVRYFTLIDFLYGPQPIWTGAVAIKKSLLITAGLFPESNFRRGGDMDTWSRCLWHSKRSIWLNKTMSYYHMDSVNMVTKNVERDLVFIFSPFLQELSRTSDSQLQQAVKYYQNNYLYILLNGNVYRGGEINYDIVKRMDLSLQGLWLITKLHLNRIRLAFRRAQIK